MHSVLQHEGVHHVATGALATRPWEYRYIRVYPDRITHTCICPHSVRISKIKHAQLPLTLQTGLRPEDIEQQVAFWINCRDENHLTVESYHDGLPHERDFAISVQTAGSTVY